MIEIRNPKHQVLAWYFAPIYPDLSDDESLLDWDKNPISFWCRKVTVKKENVDIGTGYFAQSDGEAIETDSDIVFDTQGKIAFGRTQPDLKDAIKITPEGLSEKPLPQSEIMGNRFLQYKTRKTIQLG